MKLLRISFFIVTVAFLAACSGGKQEAGEQSASEAMVKVVGKEVTYSTDSTTMIGYLAKAENASDKRPGVLVIHEWWGHNEYVRERADMLAEMGYTALAVDMYGDGKQASHPEDAGKFAMSVMSNMDEAKARFTQAMETLKADPSVNPEQIAVIGYCFGGSVALTMANAGMDLDAVAVFHAGLQLPIMPQEGQIKAKILVCHGAADPFVPAEQVAAFTAAMDSAKADYQFIAYENAVHGFTSKGADALGEKFSLPLAYNAEADQKSWDEMKALFSSVFN